MWRRASKAYSIRAAIPFSAGSHVRNETLPNQVTNHHVLFYLLICGCQSVLSVAAGLVSTVMDLWPRIPLVLRQVPVSQRQRSQSICCILLESHAQICRKTHSDTEMHMVWSGKKSGVWGESVFKPVDTRWHYSSIQPSKSCVYSHWGDLKWCSSVPGYWGGVYQIAQCQLLYSTDGSCPLGCALKMNKGIWWWRKKTHSIILLTAPSALSNSQTASIVAIPTYRQWGHLVSLSII